MTKIEWSDMTINPVVGCSHCSPGCENCYAERFAARLADTLSENAHCDPAQAIKNAYNATEAHHA